MSNRIVAMPAASTPARKGPEPAAFYQRLLRLLDENAPISSFERLALEIRDAPAQAGLTERLAADIATAVRLRENFEHKRKRESELSALYETARDLSALRNTDQVLQAIVQRARQLVGSDIAYLSAADEDRDDFYVRATEGVISQDFTRIRVPRHIGVCGSVARARRPFYSSNYSADTNFDHDADIDRATKGEGIVSILGIPLELEAQVIGVLFVGDRYVRSYTPQEMAVLSSLGAFAALAIENARLLEEAQRALRMAKEANAALRAKADAIEEAAVAHEQLTELIARGGSLEDLTRRVSNLLKGQACVLDERRKVICGELPEQIRDEDLARAIRESDRLGRSVALPGETSPGARVAAVVGGSARLGALLFTRARELSASETRTLERSALVTGIVLLSLERVAQTAYRNVADIVSALLRGTADPFSLERSPRLPPGVSLSWPITLLLVELNDQSPSQASLAIRSALPSRDTIFAEFNGDLAVVTNTADPTRLAERIAEKLAESFQRTFSIVISAPIPSLEAVPAEYQSLRRCFRLLRGLGQRGRVAFEKSLSLYAVLFDEKSQEAIDLFLRTSIGRLTDHDDRRRSELAATLLAYLDSGRSVQRAADALGIHVNTLRQRLETIGQILPDWSDPARALDIHIALRLHLLRRSK